jgi:F-type H+-transporting ATPase subunit epsilon
MADTMTFDLVSPERQLASMQATSAQIPGMEGEFTALPAHAPFLTTLRPGIVKVTGPEGVREYFVTGGFADVSAAATSVLAEEAMEREALTRDVMEARIRAAEAALSAAPEADRTAAAQRLSDFRNAAAVLGF